MHGMTRFLSRKEKKHPGKHGQGSSKDQEKGETKSRPLSAEFRDAFFKPGTKTSDKDEEAKVKELTTKLGALGIGDVKSEHIEYALRTKYADGDTEKALELLMLFEDSMEGILKPYDPEVHLLGAENRKATTCYLDALLFAMFARLDSFEGMLFNNFEDEPRKKLATLLRLWVNLLRTGKLITTDLTKHIQESLATCGWAEAAEVCQQDTSEAFTFITGKLELPLLTLKMDIYHTGREDAQDDHKFINERLLEVAIPELQPGTDDSVTLEECLQEYFNNRIEVKRYLQRRNTLQSSFYGESSREKEGSIHIETVELDASGLDSPAPLTPMTPMTPASANPLASPALARRPLEGRRRTDSIFSERFVKDKEQSTVTENTQAAPLRKGRPRGMSLRKEVMMPAWQFFSLIPWYTDNAPKTDAQVAAHFATQRPVLGICLKRYSVTLQGRPLRSNTFIDIPLEISLPHFVSDDRIDDDSAIFGNFKLVLQSAVCHRGVSTDSGHYVALVRGDPLHHSNQGAADESPPEYSTVKWMLFDDLAKERVTYVDINEALKKESPYLLFYQVQPIDAERCKDSPPSYDEANASRAASFVSSESLSLVASAQSSNAQLETKQLPVIGSIMSASPASSPNVATYSELARDETPTPTVPAPEPLRRPASMDISALAPHQSPESRGRSSMSSVRNSIARDDASTTDSVSAKGTTAPPTPAEEGRFAFLTPSSRRSSKIDKLEKPKTKSRPTSQSGENRLAATVNLLTGRKSRDRLSDRDEFAVVDGTTPVDKPSDAVMNAASKFGSIGRSKSKKKRAKSDAAQAHKGEHKGERPDRECVVM